MATVQLDIVEYNELKLNHSALKEKIRAEIESELHLRYSGELQMFRNRANEVNDDLLTALTQIDTLEQTLDKVNKNCEESIKSYAKKLNNLKNEAWDKDLKIQDLIAQNSFLSKSYQEIKIKLENTVSKTTFEKVESAFNFQREYTDKIEIELEELKKAPLIVKLEQAELTISELKAYKELYEEAVKPKTFVQKWRELWKND